ncbi:hypothetical protein FHY25_001398 [Xanthomonas arboricola]|uniref:hypothetical protein n=1 Tax=Xanthomonas campestris TaxID=339 RepID=UPI0023E94F42|nr:hypothetical protein [Xanthomonas campestris]MCW2006817.1 hypothetical protein [Xanthomonas campestris]
MKLHVYIDSCAWNYIVQHGIDLEKELPPQRYEIRVTNEIDIELAAIPDIGADGSDKSNLKQSIQKLREQNTVKITRSFGFAAPYGGFGQGTFQSAQEREWHAKHYLADPPRKRKTSGLPAGTTDADLARRASDAVVLTAESAQKSGPLKSSANEGNHVIFLGQDFESSGMSLGMYVTLRLRASG